VPDQLRTAFRRDLAAIDEQVVQLFALVAEGLSGATDAFLADDREAANALVARDKLIDALHHDIDELVIRDLSLQSPVADDLRFLLSMLRIVPELERSGDLAEHIAKRAAHGLAAEITPRARGLVEQMGRVGVDMWQMAADAFTERDATAADRLDERDDELDELHASLSAELASGVVTVPVAIEMALVARFYERLGDHAVNIARRIRYLATGTS
jgi:phosphate transport system protein